MIVKNLPCLLGDALGTLPALIELAKIHNGLTIYFDSTSFQAIEIYQMIPRKYNIKYIFDENELPNDEQVLIFNLRDAFKFATDNNSLHMNQSAFNQFHLPVPNHIPIPELEFPDLDVEICDFILVPFSRSLPPEQTWNQDNWNKLVDLMPDKKFITFGNSKYDSINYIFEKAHVKNMYDRPLVEVFNVLKKCKGGVLSVVTGISHFSHALNVRNYLFYNQTGMIWGKNPNAHYMTKYIPSYKPEEVKDILLADL